MQYTFDIAHPSSGGMRVNRPDLSALVSRQLRGGSGAGRPGAVKPPGTTTTPKPPAQWTFQPNPLDQPPTGAQPPAGQPPAPGNAVGQNPWAFSPPIQPWMFNPMGGGWGQWGGWNNIGMPPQTGGGLPPYNPQTGGQLPPYSGNISNTVPTTQPSSPYSGQPWRQL